MDNSMHHNASKITQELGREKIQRAPHSPYSPDISPCDFFLFEFLKEKLKEQKLATSKQILKAITETWNTITFETLQGLFSE
jgi:histone-lysine N-methyltransferase SETMAR